MTTNIEQDIIEDAIKAGCVLHDGEIWATNSNGLMSYKVSKYLTKFAQLTRERQASGEAVAWVNKSTAEWFNKAKNYDSGVFRYGKYIESNIPLYLANPINQALLESYKRLEEALTQIVLCGKDRDETGMNWESIANSRSSYLSNKNLIANKAIFAIPKSVKELK